MVNLGYFMAKVRQRVCHYKRKFGGISFFFYQKKVGGTVAQRGFLDYKCWYKRIVAVPEGLFSVAQRGTDTKLVFGARDPFCFFKNFFCSNIYLIMKYAKET